MAHPHVAIELHRLGGTQRKNPSWLNTEKAICGTIQNHAPNGSGRKIQHLIQRLAHIRIRYIHAVTHPAEPVEEGFTHRQGFTCRGSPSSQPGRVGGPPSWSFFWDSHENMPSKAWNTLIYTHTWAKHSIKPWTAFVHLPHKQIDTGTRSKTRLPVG